jgi:hypothetical protein
MSDIAEPIARLVDQGRVRGFDVMGPTVECLTPPRTGEPCVMRGTIPPGVSVPLHAHADPETFLMIAGEIEGLSCSQKEFEWVPIDAGDVSTYRAGRSTPFATERTTRR